MTRPKRSIAIAPIGGSSKKPGSRGDGFVGHFHGGALPAWYSFIIRYAEPLMNLGWDSIDLHLPHGRSIEADGDFERPMPYDGKSDAEAEGHYLAEGSEDAWQQFVAKHKRDDVPWSPLICYMGQHDGCQELHRYQKEGRLGTYLWYETLQLNDYLNARADMWLDAAASEDSRPDDPTHTLVRHLRAIGAYVGIEAHPFQGQNWLFDLPCWTSWPFWQQAWKRETEALTGEIIMSTGVHAGQYGGDVGAWVKANREVVEQIPPECSVAVERFDKIVDNRLTPGDFGINTQGATE